MVVCLLPVAFGNGSNNIRITVTAAVHASLLAKDINNNILAASKRPGFAWLLDRMENGDVLIVTKLDRLGRDAIDVRKTVEQLAASDIRVHCLALGGVDLTSAAGR